MTPTRAPSRRAAALLLAAVSLVAACGGPTEARDNPEIEPGSGDLGAGDVPTSADAADPDPDADADGGLPAEDAPGDDPLEPVPTTRTASAVACGTSAAEDEIRRLPATLLVDGSTLAERAATVQYGDDPDVEQLLRDAAASAGDDPVVTAAVVQEIDCVDDGSARLTVRLVVAGEPAREKRASAMLVDGSWRLTLDTFCRWNVTAPCSTVPGLLDKARDALSAALRAAPDD